MHPAAAALQQAGLEVAAHVLLPLLALWALQYWLSGLERKTREVGCGGGGSAGGWAGDGLKLAYCQAAVTVRSGWKC